MLRDGKLVDELWHKVVVGDVIKMENDQFVAVCRMFSELCHFRQGVELAICTLSQKEQNSMLLPMSNAQQFSVFFLTYRLFSKFAINHTTL